MSGSASAALIGSTTQVDFTNGSTSFGYDSANTNFTFTDVSGGFPFNPNAVGVATANGAEVTVLGPPFNTTPLPTIYQDPSGGFPAQEFGPDAFVSFAPFATETTISGSGTLFIIGLRDLAADGYHYGYGEFAGTELLSYAFETTPNTAVLAGAFTSPVPLPSSAPLFGAAVLALGALGYRSRRKARSAAA